MNLDLLERQNKYSNGFCHWPKVAWTKPDGSWQPSEANFTSLADPKAIGSGHTALVTLMHEAGHAAVSTVLTLLVVTWWRKSWKDTYRSYCLDSILRISSSQAPYLDRSGPHSVLPWRKGRVCFWTHWWKIPRGGQNML